MLKLIGFFMFLLYLHYVHVRT